MIEKKVILIFGKRGSGKSFLAKSIIAKEKRLLVYDIMSEYSQGVVFATESLAQFRRFWLHTYRGRFRLIYRPIRAKEEILSLAEMVFALGNMTLVVEEIDAICTAYDLPDPFSYIVQRGRHKQITLIGITPAPFGIHRDLTRQAKEIYIFNTNEPRDIQYLSSLLGSAIGEKIQSLGQYQYVLWRDGIERYQVSRAGKVPATKGREDFADDQP